MGFNSREGLHVEELGDGYLVLDPDAERVYQLTGDQAEAFALAQAGAKSVPDDLTAPMAGLVSLGLVTTADWSRRKVLGFGGAAAAAAVTMIALPSVAAAASVVSMQYLVVAGGGGGGAGGGGAGEVLENTAGVVVTPTTWGVAETYNVTVGGGGGYTYDSIFGNNIPRGLTGANSTLSGAKLTGTLTTRGGGGQTAPGAFGGPTPGLAGGSGGGGGVNGGLTLPSAGSAGGASTAVAPGKGNVGGAGGNASSSNKTNGSGGGGGGAGGAGGNFVANTQGSNFGGIGVMSTLASNWSNSPAATKVGQQNPSSTSQWFVGGGGGGAGYQYYGSGGLGGGGNSGSQVNPPPSPHPDAYLYTGGGGGGQGIASSGIVIVAVSPTGHVHPPSGQPSVYSATISGVDYLVFTNPNTSTITGSGDSAKATTIANFTTTFTIT